MNVRYRLAATVALVAFGIAGAGVTAVPASAATASSMHLIGPQQSKAQMVAAVKGREAAASKAKSNAIAKAVAAAAAAAKAAAAAAAAAAAVSNPSTASSSAVVSVPDETSIPTGNVTTNGRTWVQSYAEDFTKPAALGQFQSVYPNIGTYDGQRDTSGQGLYAPAKVLSVSGGSLDFWLHSENGQPLVATILPDNYTPHVTGRVSIRYKTTLTTGYKFVGMMWPEDNNWNEGEIDWPEGDLGQDIRPASATPGSYSNGNMTFQAATKLFAGVSTTTWHTATTEWDKGIVRFYLDGRLISSTTSAVPTTAMRVTLQAETFIGEGTVPANASGHLDIDWISIWN